MAYVPGFEYDAFISYARENNLDRWVTVFHHVLTTELTQLLGRPFCAKSVFFDEKKTLTGLDLSKTFEPAARNSAVLIPVLSPSYFASDWCNKERRAFLEKLMPGDSPAEWVTPVLIRDVPEEQIKHLFPNSTRFAFFPEDTRQPWPPRSARLASEVKRFAREVMPMFRKLRGQRKPAFLGRVPRESVLRDDYEEKLQRLGLRVEPVERFVFDDGALLKVHLRQAVLSLHFLGGAQESELKAVQFSTEVCRGTTILYRPPEVEVTSEERVWLSEFERAIDPTKQAKYSRIEDAEVLMSVLTREAATLGGRTSQIGR
jgi:hypothetical protein